MKLTKWIQISFLTLAITGMLGLFGQRRNSDSLYASGSLSLRDQVDQTCGACHANFHVPNAGGFDLSSGAGAHAGGIVAQTRGIDPTAMSAGDPTTALIIQKPMLGSSTLHGGIKISSTTAVMQALIAWVQSGAPAAALNRPAPIPLLYTNGSTTNHLIVYSRRKFRRGGFRTLTQSGTDGNIWKLSFTNDPSSISSNTITQQVNISNLPSTDDAQNPTVSLDGTKVAFARKQPGQPWQIWECGADGSGLRQITTGAGDKVQPFYLPYLPDGTPARSGEGGIGFLSNAADFRDEYETSVTNSLYVCDTDGGHVRQIEFNPSHDAHPWLHSSGLVVFTRWEHNEHQGHNFMPLFAMCASDYDTAGTNLFGAYGEHFTSPAGNSLHEASEVFASGFEQTMLAQGSNRDDAGGSIVGFMTPRLQGEVGTAPVTNVIAQGDNDSMKPEPMTTVTSSMTYRYPRSLLNDLFVVSMATALSSTPELQFNGSTETVRVYGNFSLYTFNVVSGAMENRALLLQEDGYNIDEAIPLMVKNQPPKIGKPIDLTMNTGTFTSGNVTDRQNDGQPKGFTVSDVSTVRFIRALQLSQGRVDTGRRNRGISSQIVGEAPIAADGSFSAQVPAEVPLQFQLLDRQKRVLVNHKPWVQVMRGETMRCVGCHAPHSEAPVVQTLFARELPPANILTGDSKEFQFSRDIQPILTAKCASCHNSALKEGAAGRSRALSLTDRFTPANQTEAFQSLVGDVMGVNGLVISQRPLSSPLMWWLTGLKLDASPPTAYPGSAQPDKVDHPKMLTEAELGRISDWIGTGVNYRVVEDNVARTVGALDSNQFVNVIQPLLMQKCGACHTTGNQGAMAMNLDKDPAAETAEEALREQIEVVAFRCNFVTPGASVLLRKPLGAQGGLSHVGGQIFSDTTDPDYLKIFRWISAANVAAAQAPLPTDMVSVSCYPNPFRDKTTIVYGLTGAAATSVQLKIYSVSGKMIRELSGPTDQSITIGWNKVEWDGKDKDGKIIGNDVYFYVIEAQFTDGTKKKFRGKCVKVN